MFFKVFLRQKLDKNYICRELWSKNGYGGILEFELIPEIFTGIWSA